MFGVHDEDDAAVPVVRALRARFPERDIVLVADATEHGSNPKVGNLINMLPAARHGVLVIADSDVHARPDYLRRLSETLARPNVGVATTLYTGLPAWRALAACSAPPRSRMASCPALCWPARWAGATVWARQWLCAARP